MRIFLLASFLLIVTCLSVSAAFPIIEFNYTKVGSLNGLPYRYLPYRNQFSWQENGTTYFNISKYVELPEEQDFTFTSNNPENIIITIDNEKKIFSIRPKAGWTGEERVVIYAEGIGSDELSYVDTSDFFLKDFRESFEKVFLERTLYSMFNSKINGLAENSGVEDDFQVDSKFDFDRKIMLIDVGDDVKIIASFYGEENAKKPRIDIKIDAGLTGYSSSAGHCSDNLKNYDETGVDCGGECVACQYNRGNVFVYAVLITVTCMAIILIGYSLLQKRDVRRKEVVHKVKISRSEMRHSLARQVALLKNTANEKNMDKTLQILSRLVRNYFKLTFKIKYHFTYFELKNELRSKNVSSNMKERMLRLFNTISKAEYGNYKLTVKELVELINEAENIIERFELKN